MEWKLPRTFGSHKCPLLISRESPKLHGSLGVNFHMPSDPGNELLQSRSIAAATHRRCWGLVTDAVSTIRFIFVGSLGGLPGETHTRKSPSTMLRLRSKDSSSALPGHSVKKHCYSYSIFCLNRVGDQTFVLSWLHSSLRRSSHLNMHKRARIHERGGLQGMTLGSTNLVGKAIQDGQRG